MGLSALSGLNCSISRTQKIEKESLLVLDKQTTRKIAQQMLGIKPDTAQSSAMAFFWSLCTQKMVKITQHGSRGTPNKVMLKGHRIKAAAAGAVRESGAAALVVGAIHQKVERHFKDFCNLEHISGKLERWLDQGDHGRDTKARARQIVGQCANNFNVLPGKPSFLFRLAQGRRDRIAIFRINPTTGKTDLPCVIVQMRGAQREQQGHALRPIHKRDQDSGWHGVRRQVAPGSIFGEFRRPGQRLRKALAQPDRTQAMRINRRFTSEGINACLSRIEGGVFILTR